MFWDLTEEEQKEFLSHDIGDKYPEIVVELDEWSKLMFYNERFALLQIRQYYSPISQSEVFQIILESCDDNNVNLLWEEIDKMNMYPHEVRNHLNTWLERSGYFVNLEGLRSFCNLFGKYKDISG